MNLSHKQLVIVTPVYEDRDAAARLFGELSARFGAALFVIAVDDGSVRQPLDVESLRAAGLDGVVLRLRRNVGHQQAIAIGLGYAADHIGPQHEVVVMDSDGEDMPETIPRLLDRLRGGDVDVVVAQREKRVETIWFKAFYAIYKRFFGLMTGRAISFGNFMALKAHAVRRLVSMQELSVHVAGTVLASKLRTGLCALPRGPRYAGHSKMNFVGLTLHGFKGLMVFAEDVLVRVGIACTLTAALSVVGAIVAVGLKLAGFSTPGWFSVALGILVLIFLQTGALALMTLMLTGVVRGGTIASSIAYLAFVDEIFETGQKVETP
ncbi:MULTISPECIES: glycosyltransferase [Nitratireductor]|uniref:glycosyltransferase n=1 Tax=Nitratireductor TaxID=245876 RepID=UPI000D0DFA14|nr:MULTISPECIES: glycosyltransferase [Nitratireductor]PSM19728.1 dolichol-phosphate mannosyltransferase [Nitratireductor sp. StC3]